MAKRGRRAKKSKIDNKNVAVVFLFLISILLAILIYTKSGYIGEHLSPMLGGIMGAIKYIIPIGTFLIAIYMTTEDKDYLISKMAELKELLDIGLYTSEEYETDRKALLESYRKQQHFLN